jgi:hypothetical protein
MARRDLSVECVAALGDAVKIKGYPVVLYPVDAPACALEGKVKDAAFRAPKYDGLLERSGAGEYPNGGAIERVDDEPDHDARAVVGKVGSQETLTVSRCA